MKLTRAQSLLTSKQKTLRRSPTKVAKRSRKEDAMAMANLLYDIYKEQKEKHHE